MQGNGKRLRNHCILVTVFVDSGIAQSRCDRNTCGKEAQGALLAATTSPKHHGRALFAQYVYFGYDGIWVSELL